MTAIAPKIAPPSSRQAPHILEAEGDWDADLTPVRMFCGLGGTVLPNGDLIPEDADHYDPIAGHKAACVACKRAWAAHGYPTATTRTNTGGP